MLTSWRICVRTSRACSRAFEVSLRHRRRQLLLQRLERGLDELRGDSDQVVDLLEALVHPWRTSSMRSSQREVLGQPVLQLDPLYLGPLVAQHAEADGDVCGVAGEVGDALGEGADVGVRSGMGASCLVGFMVTICWPETLQQPLLYVYKSITFVKQLQALRPDFVRATLRRRYPHAIASAPDGRPSAGRGRRRGHDRPGPLVRARRCPPWPAGLRGALGARPRDRCRRRRR